MTQSTETESSNFDRLNDALRGLDQQIQDLRERFDGQRRRVEDEFEKRRKQFEADFRQSPLFRQASRVRKELDQQVEQARDQVFETFGIATKHDLDKLNRKVNLLSRKLGELSREPK